MRNPQNLLPKVLKIDDYPDIDADNKLLEKLTIKRGVQTSQNRIIKQNVRIVVLFAR